MLLAVVVYPVVVGTLKTRASVGRLVAAPAFLFLGQRF